MIKKLMRDAWDAPADITSKVAWDSMPQIFNWSRLAFRDLIYTETSFSRFKTKEDK